MAAIMLTSRTVALRPRSDDRQLGTEGVDLPLDSNDQPIKAVWQFKAVWHCNPTPALHGTGTVLTLFVIGVAHSWR
jgi:hypothetical protein